MSFVRGARLAVAVALVIVAGTGVAAAQELPPPPLPDTTTTLDGTATTTAPGPTTTTTVPAGPPTTIVDPAASGDAPGETVPPDPVVVPPREPPATGLEPAALPVAASAVVVDIREVSRKATEAIATYDAAVLARQGIEARVATLKQQLADLGLESERRTRELSSARADLRRTAVEAYVRGSMAPPPPAVVLDSANPNDFYTRRTFLGTVLGAAEEAADRYAQARRQVAGQQASTAQALADAEIELEAAQQNEGFAQLRADSARFELQVYTAGGSLAIHGFVFPVAEPHTFSDTFGAPRMPGTAYAHSHQGTDIFAPAGTPLLAVERGVVVRMGTDVLGGIKLWLKGESGTFYYFAHLSGFAPGMNDGTLVEAGTVLGYVGNTGNAATTPSHLHFEVHPSGAAAINPFPILVVADQRQRTAAAAFAPAATG